MPPIRWRSHESLLSTVNAETGPGSRFLFEQIHQRKQASGRVDIIVEPMVECASRLSDDGRHLIARQVVSLHELAQSHTQGEYALRVAAHILARGFHRFRSIRRLKMTVCPLFWLI